MERPVGPGVVVVREPGVGRDLDGAGEEVSHQQRHERHGHRQPPGRRNERDAELRQVPPQQVAAGQKPERREQQHERDADANGQRERVADHRHPHDRHHHADHQPLPGRQPGRPAGCEAHSEDQAAGAER